MIDIDYQGDPTTSGTVQFLGSSTGPGGRIDFGRPHYNAYRNDSDGSAI